MSDHTNQANEPQGGRLPHRKRISLRSAVKLFMAIAVRMASGRRWGTLNVVFQDGQIVSVTSGESWVSDDQVAAAAGPDDPALLNAAL